jgi:hypothetical protein
MTYHRKAEATFRASDTSELGPIHFKVQEIFIGSLYETINTMFHEEYVMFPEASTPQSSCLGCGCGVEGIGI